MNLRSVISFVVVSSFVVFAASCSKDKKDDPKPKEPLQTVVIKDLPADPATRDEHDGHVIGGTNQYTFFRFSDSTIVPTADSASTKWDIGFRSTNIIINGGVNGPGKVEGQIVKNTLEDITEAPASGYETDTETGDVFGDWYNYNPQTHIITAKPGFIFIIHTNDGKYVKMEILSFYKGMPADPDYETAEQRYYTFRYVVQPDGTRNFSDD